MFRLRPTSVTGFPRCGSIAACHAMRPTPPSSNPACGFPALGFPGNPRLGHSQGVAQFDRSQIHQPQILEVFVCRLPFRSSKGPLAPSLEMCYQAKFKKTVDFAKCLAWIAIFPRRQQHILPKYPIIQNIKSKLRLLLGLLAQFLSQFREFLRQLNTLSQSERWAFGSQFFRSGTIVQAVLLSYRQKHVSGQAPWLRRHYPASMLLWACPTPDQGRQRVISSPKTSWLGPLPAGPPRFLDQSVSTRRPLSPRGARQLHTSVASLPTMGFTYPGRMATPRKFNEAETGSLALRLALSPHEASPDRVTPSHARSATCQTGNLQGELLSVHKIDQAWPGTPGFTGSSGYKGLRPKDISP